MKFLGYKLKHFRDSLGLSLPEVETLTGVKRGHLSDIENDKRNPRPDTVKKICNGLKIHEGYFYLDEAALPTDVLPEMPLETQKFIMSGDNIPWLALSQKAKEKGISLEVIEKIIEALDSSKK